MNDWLKQITRNIGWASISNVRWSTKLLLDEEAKNFAGARIDQRIDRERREWDNGFRRVLLSWFFTAALAGHGIYRQATFRYDSLRECEETRAGVQLIMQSGTTLSACQESEETGWLLDGPAIGLAAGIGAAATLAAQNGIASPSE